MRFLRVFYILVPAMTAILAGLAILPWIFGASAMSNSPLGTAWTIGFWALLLYAGAYQVLIIGVIVAWRARWPVFDLLNQLIWVMTILFLMVMLYVAVQFGWLFG